MRLVRHLTYHMSDGNCKDTFTWVYADQVALNCIPAEASIDKNTHMLCLGARAHWFISVTLLIATASCFCTYSTGYEMEVPLL